MQVVRGDSFLGPAGLWKEWSVVAGGWTSGNVEIVGHQIDGVDVALHLIHLRVFERILPKARRLQSR